jgi:hypothetical protein
MPRRAAPGGRMKKNKKKGKKDNKKRKIINK